MYNYHVIVYNLYVLTIDAPLLLSWWLAPPL